MTKTNSQKTSIYLAVIVLLLFTFVGLGTLFLDSFFMSMGGSNTCIFSQTTESPCAMEVQEHVSKWKEIVTATPQEVLLFLVLSVISFFLPWLTYNIRTSIVTNPRRGSNYWLRSAIFKLFVHLHIFLQKGLLHPKLYS